MAAHASARAKGGRFILRFEDLDRVTSSAFHARSQREDLAAVGVTWDEEPIFQSERFPTYGGAIDALVTAGYTYECFCSRREIREAATAPHEGPAGYPGTCRTLSPVERERRRLVRSPAVRLRSNEALITFTDKRNGQLTVQAEDVVLRRNDGVPAYNLAVVVDDGLQGVTEVVRGEDLLEVTASQILLQRLLGLPTPQYHHVPLMLGPDGERLSKRHGAVTLRELLAEGSTVDEVVSALWADLRAWFEYGQS